MPLSCPLRLLPSLPVLAPQGDSLLVVASPTSQPVVQCGTDQVASPVCVRAAAPLQTQITHRRSANITVAAVPPQLSQTNASKSTQLRSSSRLCPSALSTRPPKISTAQRRQLPNSPALRLNPPREPASEAWHSVLAAHWCWHWPACTRTRTCTCTSTSTSTRANRARATRRWIPAVRHPDCPPPAHRL